ncbi:hypothetical protein [Nonomuraea sp. GTA35]|uniref:hypothetical protein n=1 Tax=Nonomuraea sp. GTA35 TaxID=1676746 RepID=UPI0035BF58DB
MPEYRDRNSNYVPEKLLTSGKPQYAEIGYQRAVDSTEEEPVMGRVAHGLADELNRDHHWQWADVSGNGTHWARFEGHRVQIDVQFHTHNRREVNDWKGRDEIRAEGVWTLGLNRQQCWEGFIHADPLATLREIPRIIGKLIEHPAIDWFDSAPAAEQLVGRRIYYDRTPAVVSSASVLHQGAVMVQPVGVEFFPAAVYELDQDNDGDRFERQQYKVDLLSPLVWWWREKRFGDEPEPPMRDAPEPVEVPQTGV